MIAGIFWLIYSLGIWVENPSAERLVQLLFLGVLAFFAMAIQSLQSVKNHPRGSFLLGLIAPVALALLEQQSKFSINDFFQMLYFVILLNLYYLKDSTQFKWVALASGMALTWKYIYIASVSPDLLRMPQMIVSISLYLLVAVILWLSIRLSREKQQMEALNQTLEERQLLLSKTNERLESLMDEVETLTVFRERQKMAREIHDTVGHELTALTMKLELSKYFSKTDQEKGLSLLEESIEDSRRALRSTRQVVETLNNIRRSEEDLNQLISKYALNEGLTITLQGQALMNVLGTEHSHVVYRAVQESITNCIKHSSATRLDVLLTNENQQFCLKIGDNGNPAAQLEEGYGLKGMRDRVEELGGRFDYACRDGFEINICFDSAAKEAVEGQPGGNL